MGPAIANTHRFFVDATTFANATTTDANLLHQWSRVLRLRIDQTLLLLDGTGLAAVVRITELTPKRASWQVVESFVATGERDFRSHLPYRLSEPIGLNGYCKKPPKLVFVPLCQSLQSGV